jgi:hypothetical protein
MWELWDYFLATVVGWDHLTPQGIRFGIASFLALRVIAPGRAAFSELVVGLIFSAAAGILVAQAISLGALK